MGAAAFLVDKMISHLAYPPTECQKRLFETVADFAVQYGESDILLVRGYAGTGKTSAIAAFVRTLRELDYKYVLLSPTGRSAKVLSGFTGEKASTIHKHIYRQKSLAGGLGEFQLDINKAKDTFFIVDEASLISSASAVMQDSIFGSGDLLSDFISFVRSGVDNKRVIIGDKGQLPPVGMEKSPALDEIYMSQFGKVMTADLSTVVRQAEGSGTLTNAEGSWNGTFKNGKMNGSFKNTKSIGTFRAHQWSFTGDVKVVCQGNCVNDRWDGEVVKEVTCLGRAQRYGYGYTTCSCSDVEKLYYSNGSLQRSVSVSDCLSRSLDSWIERENAEHNAYVQSQKEKEQQMSSINENNIMNYVRSMETEEYAGDTYYYVYYKESDGMKGTIRYTSSGYWEYCSQGHYTNSIFTEFISSRPNTMLGALVNLYKRLHNPSHR